MSRRRTRGRKRGKFGESKYRQARVQRFNSKHPERVGRLANKKGQDA